MFRQPYDTRRTRMSKDLPFPLRHSPISQTSPPPTPLSTTLLRPLITTLALIPVLRLSQSAPPPSRRTRSSPNARSTRRGRFKGKGLLPSLLLPPLLLQPRAQLLVLLPGRLLALPPAVPHHHADGAAREGALPDDFHQAADVAGFRSLDEGRAASGASVSGGSSPTNFCVFVVGLTWISRV